MLLHFVDGVLFSRKLKEITVQLISTGFFASFRVRKDVFDCVYMRHETEIKI